MQTNNTRKDYKWPHLIALHKCFEIIQRVKSSKPGHYWEEQPSKTSKAHLQTRVINLTRESALLK